MFLKQLKKMSKRFVMLQSVVLTLLKIVVRNLNLVTRIMANNPTMTLVASVY